MLARVRQWHNCASCPAWTNRPRRWPPVRRAPTRRASPASRSSYPTASRWPPRWPVHRPSQARPVPLDSAALPATRPLAAVDRDSLSSRPWWCLL